MRRNIIGVSTGLFLIILGSSLGISQGVKKVQTFVQANTEDKEHLAQAVSALHEELNVLKTQLGVSQNTLEEAKKTNAKLSTTIEDERKLRLESETQLQKQVTDVATQSKRTDVATIIREWRPRIALVSCSWNSGQKSMGSGLLIGNINGEYQIQTNKHVVYDDRLGKPTSCTIHLPDDATVNADQLHITTQAGIDSATIIVSKPTPLMLAHTSSILPRACSTKADIGDPIVVLGYPAIGSTQDLTATEGIISGYDENYYVTSAKIEQGNSGGAAISLKNNCYLGIPTLTYVGRIESLGRILNWQSLPR